MNALMRKVGQNFAAERVILFKGDEAQTGASTDVCRQRVAFVGVNGKTKYLAQFFRHRPQLEAFRNACRDIIKNRVKRRNKDSAARRLQRATQESDSD